MPPDYTLEQWMRGVPPPPKPIKREYTFGIGLSSRGKFVPYVVRAGTSVPPSVVRILEEHGVTATSSEANRLRNDLLKKHEERAEAEAKRAQEEEVRRAEVGRVAAHSDGQGIHMAIVLVPGPETFALFLTSRPSWARCYRQITPEEGALVGLRSNQKATFLAPVVRPRAEFSLTPRQFPESRVTELLQEFPLAYAS